MNINPFKRIADLEAKLEAMEADHTKRFIELTDHWNRVAKVEKQAAAATSMASAAMDVMAKLPKLPSTAVMEQAIDAVQILDMQVDNLMSENKARKVGAEYLDKRISALGEDVVLLKASRNMVTPEEVSRKAISTQIERDRAKQREYNAAYRARQKAKAEAEAKKARQREYKRAWTARKKAELAAAQEAAK
jgi:FtsZ-binding cell division protein ZapB